mmetsp:Transcript_58561/g.155937  ORF Transcript_58561/g.155937 Transcript_58561/m.155937 type:complete len:253 (-) Transcript_58561:92-850(-)
MRGASHDWRHIVHDHLLQHWKGGGMKGRPPGQHLVHHTAQGPEVGAKGMHAALLEEFWSHVVWSAAAREHCLLSQGAIDVVQTLSVTNIADLEHAVLVAQNVCRLQVRVDDGTRMDVQQARKDIVGKLSHLTLGQQSVLLQQTHQVTTGAVLVDDPQVVSCLVPVDEFHHILMPQLGHGADLHHDLLPPALVDALHGDISDRVPLSTFINRGVLAATDFFIEMIVIHLRCVLHNASRAIDIPCLAEGAICPI